MTSLVGFWGDAFSCRICVYWVRRHRGRWLEPDNQTSGDVGERGVGLTQQRLTEGCACQSLKRACKYIPLYKPRHLLQLQLLERIYRPKATSRGRSSDSIHVPHPNIGGRQRSTMSVLIRGPSGTSLSPKHAHRVGEPSSDIVQC